jgi:hypothetical protein
MKFNAVKYFSTLIVFAAALLAGWWMWNYYMQSPWTAARRQGPRRTGANYAPGFGAHRLRGGER